ncbi:MAG: hypothetical protein QOF78_4435 [Phycisphaerales bacterium]|nr:hypothetical protein [Phycisphaerales bacterium]
MQKVQTAQAQARLKAAIGASVTDSFLGSEQLADGAQFNNLPPTTTGAGSLLTDIGSSNPADILGSTGSGSMSVVPNLFGTTPILG